MHEFGSPYCNSLLIIQCLNDKSQEESVLTNIVVSKNNAQPEPSTLVGTFCYDHLVKAVISILRVVEEMAGNTTLTNTYAMMDLA